MDMWAEPFCVEIYRKKRAWRVRKSQFMWKFTGKMPHAPVPTSITYGPFLLGFHHVWIARVVKTARWDLRKWPWLFGHRLGRCRSGGAGGWRSRRRWPVRSSDFKVLEAETVGSDPCGKEWRRCSWNLRTSLSTHTLNQSSIYLYAAAFNGVNPLAEVNVPNEDSVIWSTLVSWCCLISHRGESYSPVTTSD